MQYGYKLVRHPGTDLATTQESLYIQGPRRTDIFLKGELVEQFQSQGPLHRMGTKAALSACLPLCVLVGNPATWGPGWLPKPCPDSLSDESKYSSDLTSPTTHPTTRKTTVLNPNAHIPLLNVIYGKTNICFHRRRKLSTFLHPGLLGPCEWLWRSATLNSCFITCIT